MGNYYEGNLEFFFKDIPKDMMDLIIMREGYESIEKCREKYPAVNWLQHERANSPSFHLKELTIDEAKEEGIKYYLCINFCHKGYRLGFDLGESIVNYFQPYNYVGKYNEHGYIGKIEDEDDTYSREFWSDYSWLKSEQEKRECLCKDCPHSSQWKKSLCKKYKICNRAYDLGKDFDEKRGTWLEHKWAEEDNGMLISNYECSECHNWKRDKSEFCPECGVRMNL